MRRLHRRTARARRCFGFAVALVALAATASTTVILRSPERAGAASTAGYWLVGTDGGVFNFGQAGFYGSTGGVPLNQPIVGLGPAPSGRGYWMVASDGGIFAFGDAGFHGSMGGKPLNKPIVALAPTKSGRGYWLVAADGGIFAFGDAGFYGSMGGSHLNKPIVDIAATPTGRGYWLTSTDGGIFAFGDAGFFGSTGAIDLVKRIQAMTPAPSGRGYWLVAGDGGIFAFGDAGFFGSAAASGGAEKRVIDIAPSATGHGYYVTTSNGQILAYGDAKNYGGTDQMRLNNRIVAMSAMNAGEPPVAVEDVLGIDEDLPVTVDVLANDRDPDGGQLSVKDVGAPLRGVAAPSGRGVTYTPNADYNGPDFFNYTVSDDNGNTATGRVNITIKAVDDKPAVVPDTAAGPEDTPVAIPVLANDTGLGDGLKTLTVSDGPGHGKATVNADHTITFVPDQHYNGDDSFTYKVVDSDDDSDTGKATVTVIPVDNVPATAKDSAEVRAGKSAVLDVTSNDDSPDGISTVKFADDQGNPTEASEVTTALNGTAKRDADKIVYTAPKKLAGVDTFKYVVVDNDGDVSPPATVDVTVAANGAPIAHDGRVRQVVNPGETVQGTISEFADDPEGDSLSFSLKTKGVGEINLHKDGTFTYTAPTDGTTADHFSFAVTDGNQDSNIATIDIEIAPPPPTTTTTEPPPPPAAAIAPLAGAGGLAHRWRRRRLGRAGR
jgi:hypothetical protein